MAIRKLKDNNLVLGVVGVLILALGVFVGVFLVGQNQDFRNIAKETDKGESVVICHRTRVGWEQIEVSYDDLKLYIDSGDILGDCPM